MLDRDERPWGMWEDLAVGDGYRVKRLRIDPGQRISLQKHHHRAEFWVIAQGSGVFTINDSTQTVSPGSMVHIKVGDVHRIECTSDEAMIIIETQLGTCDENDIVRLSDDYGRSPT